MNRPFHFYRFGSSDEFEMWLFRLTDVQAEFVKYFNQQTHQKLDHSLKSLDILEAWLLEKYQNADEIQQLGQRDVHVGVASYLGGLYVRHLGATWNVNLEDVDNVYYALPVLEWDDSTDCPLATVTTALTRRHGDFLSGGLARRVAARQDHLVSK